MPIWGHKAKSFSFIYFCKIVIPLICKVVLVSGVEQRDSVIYIYIYIYSFSDSFLLWVIIRY